MRKDRPTGESVRPVGFVRNSRAIVLRPGVEGYRSTLSLKSG